VIVRSAAVRLLAIVGPAIVAPAAQAEEFCLPEADPATELGSHIEDLEAWLDLVDPAPALARTPSTALGAPVVAEGDDEIQDSDVAVGEIGPPPAGELHALAHTRAVWPPVGTSTIVSFDIPIEDNERVHQWINFYRGRGHGIFDAWLSRITRWAPVFWPVLEKHGLPRDLIYLAMIESGFSPRAYSWANASGPWQFVAPTGRRMGLKVDFWVDERRDFERSTEAAARYLKALHDEFEDWNLAWAAYNAGENRVRWALGKSATRDYWKMNRFFYRETRHYVPKLIAAALVSKSPSLYGFESVQYQEPLSWEVVTVTVSTDLRTITAACSTSPVPVSEDDLRALNPALYRGVTPPAMRWEVRVPSGSAAACGAGLSVLSGLERLTYRYHRVTKGDTPARLAKDYHTTESAILAFNHLGNGGLAGYDAILIPLPVNEADAIPVVEPRSDWSGAPPYTPGGEKVRLHRVRDGESLWRIARMYGTSTEALRRTNGLWKNSRLRIGQVLRIAQGR
jgi:membrane-bound lytic murein transglycosylase D